MLTEIVEISIESQLELELYSVTEALYCERLDAGVCATMNLPVQRLCAE